MIADDQQGVIDFLGAGENHGGVPVSRIDTHLSHIFIVGDLVYKIKRSVRYDFADLSSLEKRRLSCENEIAVNRPMAAAMYHGVVPLHAGPAGISWDGPGPVVEWAVKMARFDAGGRFDELIETDGLDDAMMRGLADRVAAFHLDAPRVTEEASAATLGALIEEIAGGLEAHALGRSRQEDVARWGRSARAAAQRHEKLLVSRRRHGFVRHCHGDLHLANICLFRNEVTPFDALEFNDDLARIDVLYDLAFVLMDLIRHRRGDLANILLNRYLGATRDYGGLALMPLFLSLRAGVRAMVLSLPSQPEEARAKAAGYLDLAIELIERRDEPALFAVGGYSGTGKSSAAGLFAMETDYPAGMIILHSDEIRKRLCGCSPESRLGAEGYTRAVSAGVYRRMRRDALRVLRAGWPVILDATFLDEAERDRARALAARAGVAFEGIWLTAPRSVLFGRVAERKPGISDATGDVLARQLEQARDPRDWAIINTEYGLSQTLDCIRQVIGTGVADE